MIKKGDIIIALLCLIASGIVAVLLLPHGGENRVVVSQNNKTVYLGSIFKDTTIKLEHNTVTVKNGAVYMEYSDCKNQICVKHKKISKPGESIVCLPNGVIAEID